MSTADPHLLTGAYALHALPDDERADFERHLSGCESCAVEVAEFTATAARLASAASEPVRAALRGEVLRRVTGVRQVPPGKAAPAQARRSVPRGRGPARWALAACVAAAAVFGGTAVWQYERAQDARQQAALAERHADQVAGVLGAPDAATRSARMAGGTGTLVVSAGRDRAVFVASGMAAPPEGKVYQLWFADGGRMRPAGLLGTGRGGQTVLMRGRVDGASGVGVTVEPAGGSRQPTTKPLGLLSVPARPSHVS
ncbi:anti-sigma factor [Streptomyces collinus]